MSKPLPAITNLPIDALRMFSVLADLKSISRTAEVISRSQTAVSLQLKNSEEILDTPPFLRHKGHLSLTSDGKILSHYVEQILALNDNFLNETSRHENRQTFADKQLTQLPELPKLLLGLHVKSDKTSKEPEILTQYIRPLL